MAARPKTRATPTLGEVGAAHRPGAEPHDGESPQNRSRATDRSTGYPQPGDGNDTGPICDGCGGPGPRWRCYWGERLCGPCGDARAAQFDADGWPREPWDVRPAPAVGVLGRRSLIGARGEIHCEPQSFLELAAICAAHGVEQVWVHEHAREALGWPERLPKMEPGMGWDHAFFSDLGRYESGLRRPGLSHYGRYWVKGWGGLEIHVPSYGPLRHRAPFAGTEGPSELFWALCLYQEATGGRWPWKGTGQMTSDAWLRSRYVRRERLGPTDVAPPFAEGLAAEMDAQWVRRPIPAYERRGYLVAFDVNAAYLGAAGAVSCPTGPIEHRDLFPEFAESLPGYWLFEPPPWQGVGPCPWAERSPCWVSTPTAALMVKSYGMTPLEAWVWPEHHAYLRPWADELRDVRAACLEIGGPALGAVKSIYKAGLGRLASVRRSTGAEGNPLYQPYWDQAVTALARCNLHRRLVQLAVEPIGVQVDCLYFLAERPSPHAFAASIGLPIGDGLGHYKVKGRPAPAAEALAVIDAGRPAVATCTALGEILEVAR